MFVIRRRSRSEYEFAMRQLTRGWSARRISEATGISVATINYWRRGGGRFLRQQQLADERWRPPDGPAYCYLLGLYLGDGCINLGARGSATLLVSLDGLYPAVLREAEASIGRVLADVEAITSFRTPSRVAIVRVSHPALPFVFPQHGPGRKHTRPIELVDWQEELTHRHPKLLLRGLIHSDGCRTINRFKTKLPSGRTATYEYPRYFFSNLSADIRRIFCEHCDLLGIRWTQSNHRNISISHGRSVALLDTFVGPKS